MLDVFASRERWSLVYEHHGESLADILAVAATGLTPPQVVNTFSSICKSVLAIHAAGLTHADLKPDNVLVTRRGGTWVVVVADLGSALEAFSV